MVALDILIPLVLIINGMEGMIISESNQFIFIHNPKCAGTSVRNKLKRYDTTGDLFFYFLGTAKGITPSAEGLKVTERIVDKAHMPIWLVRNLYPEYFKLFFKYYVFGFVRNPYDRAISVFNESHREIEAAALDGSDIAVRAYRDEINRFYSNLSVSDVNGLNLAYRHAIRQRDMFFLDSKCMADAVIKIENYDEQIRKIGCFQPLLLESLKEVERDNKSKYSPNSEDTFSPEVIKHLNYIYEDDFKLFDYDML